MRRVRLSDVVEAVCDGTSVDWAAVISDSSRDGRDPVDELRRLCALCFPRTEVRRTDPGAERLPLAALAVVIVAAIHAGAGITEFVIRTPQSGAVPAALQALVVAALAGAAALLLFLIRGDRRTFLLAGVFMVLAAACSRRFLPTMSGGSALGLSTVWLVVYPDALLPAFTWAFVRRFPTVTVFSTIDRAISIAVVVSIAVGLILALANAAVSIAPDGDIASWVRPLARGGTSWYWLLIAVLTLPALAILPVRVRAATLDERRRVGWFLGGIAFGLLPSMIEVTLEGISPAYDHWTDRPDVAVIVGWLLYVPLFTVPLTTTYAVAARQVLGIRVAVHRAGQYALARVTLTLLTALPFAILLARAYSDRHLTVAQLAAGASGVVLLTTAAAAGLLLVLRKTALGALERRFGEVRGDLSRRAAAAVEAVRTSRGPRELSTLLHDHIGAALNVDRAVVFTIDSASRQYEASYADSAAISSESALARVVEDTDGAVDFCAGKRSLSLALPAVDREWVRATGFGVLVSLRAPSNGEPLGLMAVSGRRGGLPFVDDELSFISTIAGALALAMPRHLETADEQPAGECSTCGLVRPAGDQRCGCGGSLISAAVPPVVAGKFAPRRVLGRGGMGIVYEADDLILQRKVAIKALPRSSRRAIHQLRYEAQTTAIATHPNLIVVHGVEFWRDTPLLIMELVDGTLADRLANGPLPTQDVVELAQSLGAALEHLHARHILHLDVKPSNIGFGNDGRAKLMDFGVSTLAGEGDLAGGTPLYLSPERVKGHPPDHHADVWAMAVVLWESLTGRHPFSGAQDLVELERRMAAGIPDLQALCPTCPPGIASGLERALSLDRKGRPETAQELAEVVVSGATGW